MPTAANAEYYAEIIRKCAVRRHAIEVHTRAINDLYEGEGDLDVMVDRHEAELHTAHRDARARIPYQKLGEIVEMAIDDQENPDDQPGILTGFQDVDSLTNGFRPGEVIVVAARPAVGKSTLAVDFLRAIAIQQNIPTALFSLEMGALEIGQRVLAAEARVGLHHIRGYKLTDDDWTRIGNRVPDLMQAPMFIDTSPNLTMAEIKTRAREMHSREGLSLLAVDYLQLLESGSRRRGVSRQEEVADMSRQLKLLAKELDIPVIALSQLNRGPEQREDGKPKVSDLRESGGIEQDADMVILLHRPDLNEPESPRAGEADLIFGKCRNAPTCTITVAFQGHYSRFTDMSSDTDSSDAYRNTLPRREAPTKTPEPLPSPRTGERAGSWPTGPQAAVQHPSQGDHAELATPAPESTPETEPASISDEMAQAASSFGSDVLALNVPVPAPCPPGCVACATDESHDPAPPAGRDQEPAEPVADKPAAPAPRRKPAAKKAVLQTFVADKVARALDEHNGDQDAALNALAGDGGSAIPDVMELWEMTRVETNYTPTVYPQLPDPLVRKRKDEADDIWEARPKYRTPHPVPDGMAVTELDVNAAYLAALQSSHLPVRTLTHNHEGWQDLSNYGKGTNLAGIVRINPIAWDRSDLPHPLGDDRETAGPLWIPTSTLIGIRDFASPSYGSLCEMPTILEAYVAPGTEALFKDLVKVLNEARMQAFESRDTLTRRYVASMYAKLVSTMGDSRANHEIKRPDWVHIIRGHAFANLRRKAVRASEAGLGIVHVGGTDELHLTGDVWAAQRNGRPLFAEGRALNQIKAKNKGGDQ